MSDFTENDRDRAIEVQGAMAELLNRLTVLERRQSVSLRRIRRLPDLTATAIVQAVSRRALIFIGVGIAIGSFLGGAGIEVVRALIVKTLGGP